MTLQSLGYPQLTPELRSLINAHLEFDDFCTLASVSKVYRETILVKEFANDATWEIFQAKLGFNLQKGSYVPLFGPNYTPKKIPFSLTVLRHIFTKVNFIGYQATGKCQISYKYGLLHDMGKIFKNNYVGPLSNPGLVLATANLLWKWIRARDTLIVWEKTADIFKETGPGKHLSVSETIKKAKEFSIWCLELRQRTSCTPPIEIEREHYLSFEKQGLSALPNIINNIALLRISTLELSRNQLITLPESLSILTDLKTLKIDKNQFASLPNVIFKLTTLQELNIANNPLISLSVSLAEMQSIKHIYLSASQRKIAQPIVERFLAKGIKIGPSMVQVQSKEDSEIEIITTGQTGEERRKFYKVMRQLDVSFTVYEDQPEPICIHEGRYTPAPFCNYIHETTPPSMICNISPPKILPIQEQP